MKHYITRSIFSLLSAALLFFSISTVSSHALTCFPTCSTTDGRFLSLIEGVDFLTLTPSVMNIRIIIPAGSYQIRFEGLDMGNFVSVNPLFPLTLRGEVIPDPELPPASVPTISEWGLIALASFFGIIGVLYSRRYRRV